MCYMKTRCAVALVVLLTAAVSALASVPNARANGGGRTPDLPSPLCDSIVVEAGNEVSSRVYALGVQIYRWNGGSWVFVAPSANLYADRNYRGQVGTHYGGPTWEGNNGGSVVAARVPGTGCTPDASAIPWLKLKAVSNEGPGIFSRVTYIQRVNTSGGLAPATPGTFVNEEKEVPYTAEYFFYREKH
jgi:hypothetical protein